MSLAAVYFFTQVTTEIYFSILIQLSHALGSWMNFAGVFCAAFLFLSSLPSRPKALRLGTNELRRK